MDPVSPLPAEAQEALQRGEVIEAIKRLRSATGLGLKEAKEVVDARMRGGENGEGETAPAMPPAAAATTIFSPDVIEAMHRGNKIEAIRLLRGPALGAGGER